MFFKHMKLNLKNLSNEVTSHDLSIRNHQKLIEQLKLKQDALNENQRLLFKLLKMLADCFQLEYRDGKYYSKKNIKKRRSP